MIELFGCERDDGQGLLFARTTTMTTTRTADAPVKGDELGGRRPGETALDYRIRRQYRDVTATAPLFAGRGER